MPSAWMPAARARDDGAVLAGLQAGGAADAALGIEQELGRRGLALGVVAPGAVQWATLHKDGGADARAVVDGKALDVEYEPCLGRLWHGPGLTSSSSGVWS